MKISNFMARARNRYWRLLTDNLARRDVKIEHSLACVSFTFDDFPRTALYEGGRILKKYNMRGTYYAAFGLMGQNSPVGVIFTPDDIKEVEAGGHELGCHTFGHCHALDTPAKAFEESIRKNKEALLKVAPGVEFGSFSYPISAPTLVNKKIAGGKFIGARGGGQTFNTGSADMNLLKAFFIEKSRDKIGAIKELIDRTCKARGWLILATHDICAKPSPFGCTPSVFEEIVKYTAQSGALVLPVAEAATIYLPKRR